MLKISEMAYNRSDAIDRCASLGKQFIEHFIKIMDAGGKSDPSFVHHCQEMSTWLKDVREITLKPKNKPLNSELLMDWFFTKGSSIDIIIPEKYENVYSSFIANLIANKHLSVADALSKAIDENK